MKKIIAAAVATAFVAPVYAADVTVSGDVEFVWRDNGTATFGETGDADYTIAASEEINGLGIVASVDEDEDARLILSGAFGSVAIGNDGTDNVLQAIDEAAAVAEKGAGQEAAPVVDGNDLSVVYTTAVANGVTAMIGYAAGNQADNHTAVQYGLTGSFGPVSVGLAGEAADTANADEDDALVYNVAVEFGPVYVAYEASSNRGGEEDLDGTAWGATYNYGPGKVFYEANSVETGAGIETTDLAAYGVSYKIAGDLNTYLSIVDNDLVEDNSTIVGIEYKF
jgi:hypothetical protein